MNLVFSLVRTMDLATVGFHYNIRPNAPLATTKHTNSVT